MAYQKKRAQGLSINTIIIAALGLAVLVILFAVMTGRLSIFGKGVDSTQQQLTDCNQQCKVQGFSTGVPTAQGSCSGNNQQQIFGSFSDERIKTGGEICCCTRA